MSWRNIIKSSTTDRLFDELIETLGEYHPHFYTPGDETIRLSNAYQINMARKFTNEVKVPKRNIISGLEQILTVLKRQHEGFVRRTGENMRSSRNVDFIATIEEIIQQLISEVETREY